MRDELAVLFYDDSKGIYAVNTGRYRAKSSPLAVDQAFEIFLVFQDYFSYYLYDGRERVDTPPNKTLKAGEPFRNLNDDPLLLISRKGKAVAVAVCHTQTIPSLNKQQKLKDFDY